MMDYKAALGKVAAACVENITQRKYQVNFVEWCDFVLKTCINIIKTSPKARSIGVDEHELAQALSASLGIPNFRARGEYYKSTCYAGMFDAIRELKAVGLIENNDRSNHHWKASRSGYHHITDQVPLWSAICQEQMEMEHAQLLSLVNRLSPHAASDHGWLEPVQYQVIVSELGAWPIYQAYNVARELNEWGYVSGLFSAADTFRLTATYKGLIWETKGGFQYASCFISYAHQDQTIAKRLHSDLCKNGVSCWFAPHDLRPGTPIMRGLEEAIHLQDKFLLVLSEHAVNSAWIEREVDAALYQEIKRVQDVLFPIRLDNAVLESNAGWATRLQHRHIGDFTGWQDEATYQQAFATLLRHLKVTKPPTA